MAWQYTEYAGCPTITDREKKQFKFGIILDVDTTDIKERSIDTPDGPIKRLEFRTNNKLRPRYYMRIGNNKSSVLNLDFNRVEGLKRRIWTDQGIVEMQGVEYQSLKSQIIDTGNFDTFKLLGKYAVRRFPAIAQEIVLPLETLLADIPEDQIDEIKKYTEACQSFPSWESVQRDISNEFYQYFIIYTRYENRNNSLEKRTDLFTKEQVKFLDELVKPLQS